MKMKALSLTLTALLLLALSSAAFAQVDEVYYITLKPGAFFPRGDLKHDDFGTGFNGEIGFGWRPNPNFAAEMGLGYFDTDARETFVLPVDGLTASGKIKADLDVYPITLTLKGILPYKQWEFYGLGGIGAYLASADLKGNVTVDGLSASFHLSDSVAAFGGFLGLGFHYNLTKSIFIGTEGKYLWTSTAKFKDDLYGVSVSYETDLDGIQAMAVIGLRF
jgi:opacity protein-like surface antigen